MKSKQPENPLKSMEEQLDRILFNNSDKEIKAEECMPDDANQFSLNSIKKMKSHLIYLVKELKAKNLYLVA